jgi:predicted lipid-binding transport protein (Tim44 family)
LRTKTKRWKPWSRESLVFPDPSQLEDAAAADKWATLARMAAAEHASDGAFGTWFGGVLGGLIFGIVGTQVIDIVDPSAGRYWQVLVAGVIVSVVMFGVATAVVLVFTWRPLRRAYASGPMWLARAEAYARRSQQLQDPVAAVAARSIQSSRWALLILRHHDAATPRREEDR